MGVETSSPYTSPVGLNLLQSKTKSSNTPSQTSPAGSVSGEDTDPDAATPHKAEGDGDELAAHLAMATNSDILHDMHAAQFSNVEWFRKDKHMATSSQSMSASFTDNFDISAVSPASFIMSQSGAPSEDWSMTRSRPHSVFSDTNDTLINMPFGTETSIVEDEEVDYNMKPALSPSPRDKDLLVDQDMVFCDADYKLFAPELDDLPSSESVNLPSPQMLPMGKASLYSPRGAAQDVLVGAVQVQAYEADMPQFGYNTASGTTCSATTNSTVYSSSGHSAGWSNRAETGCENLSIYADNVLVPSNPNPLPLHRLLIKSRNSTKIVAEEVSETPMIPSEDESPALPAYSDYASVEDDDDEEEEEWKTMGTPKLRRKDAARRTTSRRARWGWAARAARPSSRASGAQV